MTTLSDKQYLFDTIVNRIEDSRADCTADKCREYALAHVGRMRKSEKLAYLALLRERYPAVPKSIKWDARDLNETLDARAGFFVWWARQLWMRDNGVGKVTVAQGGEN